MPGARASSQGKMQFMEHHYNCSLNKERISRFNISMQIQNCKFVCAKLKLFLLSNNKLNKIIRQVFIDPADPLIWFYKKCFILISKAML